MPTAHLHRSACAELKAWTAPHPNQTALQQRYILHLAQHPDGLTKTGPAEHLTASAIIITATGSHVLLTLHTKAKKWLQTGGHLEPGDTSLAAGALREAVEESGLVDLAIDPDIATLSYHRLANTFGHCTAHLDVQYVVVCPELTAPTISAESTDLAWFPVTALPAETDQTVRDLVAIAVERCAQGRYIRNPAITFNAP